TGVTCGDPSGITVARIANAFFCCNRSRYLSGMVAMTRSLPKHSRTPAEAHSPLRITPAIRNFDSKIGCIRFAKALQRFAASGPTHESSFLGIEKSVRFLAAAHALTRAVMRYRELAMRRHVSLLS